MNKHDSMHEPVPGEGPFRDGVEHIYDVKLAVAIGLVFDHDPTEDEIRQAMVENALEKLRSIWGAADIDIDADVSYEWLESEGTPIGR